MTTASSSVHLLFFWILYCVFPQCALEELMSCSLGQTCVLPCHHEGQLDQVLWTRSPGDYEVHLYVNSRDELRLQYPLYVNRTSLSEDLSRGDASLLISQVTLKDQGTFRCSTISSRGKQRHSLELRVFAPVLEVFMEQQEQQLLCRSERIYPEPSVVWTPSMEHNITVTESEQGLFSVISSVTLSDSENKYICNISTAHSWRSAAVKVKELTYRLDVLSSEQRGHYTCLQKTDSESVILRLQFKGPHVVVLVLLVTSGVLFCLFIVLSFGLCIYRCQMKRRQKLIKQIEGLCFKTHSKMFEVNYPLNTELEELESNHRESMEDSGGESERHEAENGKVETPDPTRSTNRTEQHHDPY